MKILSKSVTQKISTLLIVSGSVFQAACASKLSPRPQAEVKNPSISQPSSTTTASTSTAPTSSNPSIAPSSQQAPAQPAIEPSEQQNSESSTSNEDGSAEDSSTAAADSQIDPQSGASEAQTGQQSATQQPSNPESQTAQAPVQQTPSSANSATSSASSTAPAAGSNGAVAAQAQTSAPQAAAQPSTGTNGQAPAQTSVTTSTAQQQPAVASDNAASTTAVGTNGATSTNSSAQTPAQAQSATQASAATTPAPAQTNAPATASQDEIRSQIAYGPTGFQAALESSRELNIRTGWPTSSEANAQKKRLVGILSEFRDGTKVLAHAIRFNYAADGTARRASYIVNNTFVSNSRDFPSRGLKLGFAPVSLAASNAQSSQQYLQVSIRKNGEQFVENFARQSRTNFESSRSNPFYMRDSVPTAGIRVGTLKLIEHKLYKRADGLIEYRAKLKPNSNPGSKQLTLIWIFQG